MGWPIKSKIKIAPGAAPKQTLAHVKTTPISAGAPQDAPWAHQKSEASPATAAAHLRAASTKGNP